ncbi:putative polyamine transporter [Trifolium pratense]|uniref:Putative polyamine transporter n=1 Tax=Trifolium pratense TaxID=57577 RepID=A0A2K3PEI0_TRIPR|nr:putative polyamine transporter [Trifolium pratense]
MGAIDSDSLHSSTQNSYHQPLLNQRVDDEEEEDSNPKTKSQKKLALLPLIFLIYFEVSGGPYGEEATVSAAGPLFAILGFVIFPFIWSIPEALLTAELATTFPGNGGFVIWANEAFGPFWGSLMGYWKFFSGVINLASFPVLCIDYLKLVIPVLSSGLPRYVSIFVSTSLLSFLNYSGLAIVGYTAVVLGVISLLPFVIMSLIALPKIDPSRWVSLGEEGVKKDWTLFFNTIFWNLNFWDNASTLAGEVEEPRKTFPKALFFAGLLTCLSYIIPLLATTGAMPLDQKVWVDGYFANVAYLIAGNWLKYWMEIGAVLSLIGLFEAQLSSAAYQLLGMSDLGFLPKVFGERSKFNTPWLAILISTIVAMSMTLLSFTEIISTVNFLYSLGMLLEFASFLKLRKKFPTMKRPFRVPLGFFGLILMCFVPSVLLVYVMMVATKIVFVASGLLTLLGIVLYYFLNLCKSKKWIEFNGVGDKLDEDEDIII